MCKVGINLALCTDSCQKWKKAQWSNSKKPQWNNEQVRNHISVALCVKCPGPPKYTVWCVNL